MLDIINETYNYVESGDYGNLSFDQFLRLAKKILPSNLNSTEILQRIFQVFTGSSDLTQLDPSIMEPISKKSQSVGASLLDFKKIKSM